METTALEKAGLTKSESKVYLALLKLGQTTSGPVVDESGVSRSKIYDILERLKNKGLVSFITKDSTKYFSSADPENIVKYLDEKEEEIEKQKKEIKNFLPQLEKQYKKSLDNKKAEIFLGMKGMQNAFNVLIKEFDSKTTYFSFGAGQGENLEKIQIFFEKLHRERTKKRVKSKIIFNESSRGLFKTQEKSKLVETMEPVPPIVDYDTPANVLVPLIRFTKCILVSLHHHRL